MSMSPCDALEAIVRVMSGREWSADTCSEISGILEEAGYDIADLEHHGTGCVCADCSGAELTASND